MTPTLVDLEDELLRRMREMKTYEIDIDIIKLIEQITPTDPQLLASVYASSAKWLDKVEQDGGSVSAIISNHIQNHLHLHATGFNKPNERKAHEVSAEVIVAIFGDKDV